MQVILTGKLSGYVQGDFATFEHLRRYFSNFLPIFKNALISAKFYDTLTRKHAENENLLTQPRRMLIFSFHLTIGTLITPHSCFS